MSTFRPRQEKRVCKLNFDDKFFYELPLHENQARDMAKLAEAQINALGKIKSDDPDAFDKAYNLSLDALDELLGEGAGADIMSIYDNPSVFDLAEVITYISNEFKAAYGEYLSSQKAAGPNRADRRAAQRGRR
jgi:hypothetical protein